MGSEDLFHKRKARKNSELKRQKRERAQNARYLIVCEGTKTEPRYLHEFLDDLKIRPQLVHIMPNNGVTPDRIVEHAINLYKEDKIAGDAFDKVYCVFDRDKHTTFSSAVKRIKDLGPPFVAITSTPCFEFWLLLHFIYTNKPFHAAGKKSVGDQVVAMLKNKPGFNKYGKGDNGVYFKTKEKLIVAMENAKKLRLHNEKIKSINPATDFDLLIQDILLLKEK